MKEHIESLRPGMQRFIFAVIATAAAAIAARALAKIPQFPSTAARRLDMLMAIQILINSTNCHARRCG